MKAAGLAAIVLVLAGCAHPGAPPATARLPDLLSYELLRTDGGRMTPRPMTVAAAAEALSAYDVIVLGEMHDHPGNHVAQMALYRALADRSGAVDLSMEQFERDTQPVIDDYLAGKIGEASLRKKARAWDNYAESYRPLVEFAKARRFAVIAADPPTDIVRCIGQEGLGVLDTFAPAKRATVAASVNIGDGPYRDKFMGFATGTTGHGGGTKEAPSESALRGYAAQAARDDTMAESIVRHLAAHPGHKVVHLTGYFHAESFLGTVERIKSRNAALKVAVVNPVTGNDALAETQQKSGTFVLRLQSLPEAYLSDDEASTAIGARMAQRPKAACEG